MNVARRPAAFTALLLTTGALGAGVAYAAGGGSDPSFNGGQVQAVDFPGFNDAISDVAVAPDGTIAILGMQTGDGYGGAIAVQRLTASGAPLPGFGTDGQIFDADFDGNAGWDWPQAIAVDGAGDVYVGLPTYGIVSASLEAGWGDDDAASQGDFTIVKYAPDGTRLGVARVALPGWPGDARIVAIVPQADGGVLVAGSIFDGEVHRFVRVRLDADGHPDASFGQDGVAYDPSADGDAILGGVQAGGPEGNVVIGGPGDAGDPSFILRRYTGDADADTSYGGDFATERDQTQGDLGPSGQAFSVNNTDADLEVRRWTTGGEPDITYAGDGTAGLGFLGDELSDAGVTGLPGGRALVWAHGGDGRVVAGELDADGTPDTTFGDGGVVTLALLDGARNAWPVAGAVEADGKPILAGDTMSQPVDLARALGPNERQGFITRFTGPPEKPAGTTTTTDTTPTATTTTTTTTTTATPASSPAPVAGAGPKTAAPKVCSSRRAFKIRLRIPRGKHAKSAVVTVNGKQVKVLTGKRVTSTVDLRGLPKGKFTVSITVKLTNGKTLTGARRYKTCAVKRDGSIPVL